MKLADKHPTWTAPTDFAPSKAWQFRAPELIFDGSESTPSWEILGPTSYTSAVLWVEYADPMSRQTHCECRYSLCVYANIRTDRFGNRIGEWLDTDAFSEILSRLESLGFSL